VSDEDLSSKGPEVAGLDATLALPEIDIVAALDLIYGA
jgi:hypothetical protein